MSDVLESISYVQDTDQTFLPPYVSSLIAWYDFADPNTLYTDAGTTKVSADGQSIQQVYDKSGNKNTLSQATAGFRPLYKTGIRNSRSVLRFDGSDDYLSAAAFTLIQPETVFYVGTFVGGTIATDQSFFDGNAVNTMRLYRPSTTSNAQMYAGAAGPIASSVTQSWHTYLALYNGAGSKLYVDGGTANTGNPGAGNAGGLYLAVNGALTAGGFAQVDIAEVAIYNTALAASDQNLVGQYLSTKWGLPWTAVS